ncbi:thiol reductant ABC exporter subunit CydD [Nocardia farcinica]|uniref:thiol reductant ABC exporter subunit CydD n=1 Tax=Nocardia farcinica TaxID=37329 RepID=UPI002455A85D|nr:thiol reductant ABC exporter subunit CydD [Nocardia farcinica]
MARPPVDPRLWRHARSARRYLGYSVGLSLVTTVCIVVAATALGRVLAGVITDPTRRRISDWTAELVVLALALAGRAVASWWQARIAHRAGASVVAELETAVLAAGAALPPRELDRRRTELAVVVGTGLSGLRAYLTGYLPALLLAVLVPPVVLAVILAHDPVSAGIAVVTLPLIPIFMVLIGLLTQGRAAATLAATTRLSDQLLDLFAGMPTLRALGREHADGGPAARTMEHRVRALGDALRVRTMRALRIAFLSSMVLELLATLSVALIAVSIGLRLVYGGMDLYDGLVALILAPEVYLPLRMVGERFHAAQDGMAAADKAFAVLEPEGVRLGRIDDRTLVGATDRPAVDERGGLALDGPGDLAVDGRGGPALGGPGDLAVDGRGGPALDGRGPALVELAGLGVRARDGWAPADLCAVIRPGALTVLAGPNGSGKSTALAAILGLVDADAGRVRVDGIDVRELDPDAWWRRLAWLPQRPVLVPGTLRENLELLGADLVDLNRACATTGFDAVLDELPHRWDTVVGVGGVGLSLGQRQRLALTRVLAADRPVLLLDEPTAHLDEASEAGVLAALRERAAAGATVLVVGHRPTVLAAADQVIEVRSAVPVGQSVESGGAS